MISFAILVNILFLSVHWDTGDMITAIWPADVFNPVTAYVFVDPR